MFRFLFVFFSIFVLLVFAAAIMIKRDKPARKDTDAYPSSPATEANLEGLDVPIGNQPEQQVDQPVGSEIKEVTPAVEATQEPSDSSSAKKP